MNKTLIALAIAAALPVAAQADMTLSGSVTTKYTDQGVVDTDAALSLSASEVLANGMTATATFDVLATDGENQGSATLTGDFGTLTAGEITNDAAFQSGDVADVVGASDDSDDGDTTVSGIHFATTQAGLSLAAQVNGATGADATTAETRSTQFGATYDFNGLTVGYAYASDTANADPLVEGVTQAQTAFGAAYTFGDLVVSAGKSSVADDAIVSATYTMVVDALTVVAQMDNTPSGDYQIDLSYAMSDAITLSSEIDSTAGEQTTLVASYTSGDLTASVSKTSDGTTDASVALDFGNADLTLARNGGDEDTTVTYAVAF
ncbi:MAG: porin [Oceanospirillaceae bacterium]|nr:porin [Oceanospirillaceae bacterium]